MINKSIWSSTVKNSKKDVLKSDINTETLIIGCGISGMSIGIELHEKDVDFTMVEMNEVGSGTTGKSTGKLTYAQGSIYNKIINNYGIDTAFKYYKSQTVAIKRVESIIKKYNIDCDFERVNSCIFTNNTKDIKIIKKEEDFYNRFNIKYKVINKLPNNYPVVYGIMLYNTAIFNPLKYVYSLKKIIKKNHKVYENTKVLYIDKCNNNYCVHTNKGNITCSRIVVATHYPFFIVPAFIPLKTHIERSYVLSSKINVDKLSSITALKPTISMRSYKDNLLFSSNSHGNFYINYKKQFSELEDKFKCYFNEKYDYVWSTHDVMSNDSIPYIDKINDTMYISTAFNKWGMTNGVLSGMIISDYITNNKNKYSHIFSLNRPFSLNRSINAIKNNLVTGCTFVKNKLVKNHSFYEYAEVVKENGMDVGVYHGKDKDYKVKNICPHMKCSLVFNEIEKTWECPCHGSSFDIEGNVLTGPSTYSIKLDK